MAEVSFRSVTKQYGNGFVAVDGLDLEVGDGELLVLVGPSGCGKTTTLRMLAGLEEITSGEVRIGEQVVNELSAKERDIAMVFQTYALYPHLSVADNLAYPLRMARMPKRERTERVMAVAAQLRLDELLNRKPRQLSGGQRQRVAMGRAMVRQPQVFLMDEPLSNLDAKLRVLMRSEVAELQYDLGTTMFYVTHDQIEAMTMGHRVAIMDHGVLMQVDEPAELYRAPANLFVAGFIGSPPMNLFNAAIEPPADPAASRAASPDSGDPVQVRSGTAAMELRPAGAADRALADAVTGRTVVVGVRPERVRIGPAGGADPNPGSSRDPAAGSLPATVRLVEMLGSESLVHLEVAGLDHHTADTAAAEEAGTSTARLLAKLHDGETVPRVGDNVSVALDWADLHLFDGDSGAAITADALIST